MTKFEVAFNIPDSMWLTSNQRKHWSAKARAVKELRLLAVMTARAAQLPHLQSAHVTAYIQYRTNGRADPHNAMPTLKALIDGLVQDYGLLPDDSDKYLTGPDMRRDTGRAQPHTHRVRLTIDGDKP